MSKSRRKTKRQKQEQNKRRFDAIRDLMSTFAMSTVAVVAVVTLIPSSPKAEITKTVALSNEIVYQVQVTDEDNALDLSTLTVVLENQLEYYEHHVLLGEFSGHFENLNSNTEYRLSVYGSKGFGQERLDTLIITTNDRIGGTILSVTPHGEFDPSYMIDLSVNDPESKYTSFTLYYGYQSEFDDEIVYSSMNVVDPNIPIELLDIFTSEPFHIYLEGTTDDGTELLDEIWVTPPFHLYASVYLEYINKNEIGFYVYGDSEVGEITYEVNVYQNDMIVKSRRFTTSTDYHDGTEIFIDGLHNSSTYFVEVKGYYINPQTLRNEYKILYQEQITTLDQYTYEITYEEVDGNIEVTIVVRDPSHHFQTPYYEAWDTTGEFDVYITGMTYTFINNGDEKSVIFSIPIPNTTSYEVCIGIRNETDFIINQAIVKITNE